MNKSKFIIKGIKQNGELFRPSDWAQRLSSVNAEFGSDHRLHFSPLLHPDLSDGVVCLVVDPKLEATNPEIYKYIVAFAESNDLVTGYDDAA